MSGGPQNVRSEDLAALLNDRHERYNRPAFIPDDPIAIPHRFTAKEDIEVAGLLAATLAWGRRDIILKNCTALLARLADAPHAFVVNATAKEIEAAATGFVHRTFNATDLAHYLRALQRIYRELGGLEAVFSAQMCPTDPDCANALRGYRAAMLSPELNPPARVRKHIHDIDRGSAAKRLCMYLRWMVRRDKRGVDFGLWRGISPAQLVLPLDVHTGRVARALGLLHRKQNDWKAVQEVTAPLRALCPEDPAKYDFAIFGLGVYEGFPGTTTA